MSNAFDAADRLQSYMESLAAPYQGTHDYREDIDVRWDGVHWHGYAYVRVGCWRDLQLGTTVWLGAFAENCADAAHCYETLRVKLMWAASAADDDLVDVSNDLLVEVA